MPSLFGRGRNEVFAGDRDLIKRMRKGGEQLDTRPRETTHYLHFVDAGSAATAADKAREHGFDVRLEGPEAGRDDFQVQVSHTILVNETTITDARRCLTAIADSAGGRYDGWDTYADAALDQMKRL